MQLVLYSKPGCHLCEGLQEKLAQLLQPAFELEIRDITSRPDWFQSYQYEVPVLCLLEQSESGTVEKTLPRLSPRASLTQVAQLLQKYSSQSERK
ncbi:MAG: glutaredoxin family protein [Leptolyngbyaceae cyanobacterium SM1_1_3]|nr:glutaredoxin family protein [Leptolyngbyaceae cyanobacterium SM1_1_3]NJN04735.1 glutaredoxin family protein [Leptolyngbyaceae cyanobacterium RM1_1_2]NJO10919.1 glutaredoxin family protein [Leptolyngbyaceae cyanobacterium SL_1_1]